LTPSAWRSSEFSPFNTDAAHFRSNGDVAMTTVEAYSRNLYRTSGNKWHAEMQPSVLCPKDPPAGGEEGAVTAV
jgi:hypothetical protein